VRRALRIPLYQTRLGDATVDGRRDVGVVGFAEHRNVLRAGLVDGFEDQSIWDGRRWDGGKLGIRDRIRARCRRASMTAVSWLDQVVAIMP